MRRILWFGCFVLCNSLAISVSSAAQLSIAVAANFAAPLKSVLTEFEQQTGIQTRLTVASSGVLYAQIKHGAPFDLFLSADSARPQALVSSKKVAAQQVSTYAMGKLALVGDPQYKPESTSMLVYQRIAIADPNLAPYGIAARSIIERVGEWDNLNGRIIRGKNVQQTLQFWQSGNVDVALIALSQCMVYQLDCVEIPLDNYPPIIQQMVVLNEQPNSAARRLADYLLSETVQQSLADMGYQPVHPTHAGEVN